MNNVASHPNTFDIYDEGVRLLVEHLGIVKTEAFIATVIREQFDYTKWQRQHFDQKTPEQISSGAEAYVLAHPYEGDSETVI